MSFFLLFNGYAESEKLYLKCILEEIPFDVVVQMVVCVFKYHFYVFNYQNSPKRNKSLGNAFQPKHS